METQRTLFGQEEAIPYKYTLTNIYSINGQKMSEVFVENSFHLSLIGKKKDMIDIDLVFDDMNVKKGLEFLPQEYINAIRQVSTVRDHVLCRIEKTGNIIEILNFQELQKKWEQIKDKLRQNKNFIREDMDKMLEAGDKEFSNEDIFIEELNRNSVYKALLCALSKKGEMIKHVFHSNIFPEKKMVVQIEVEDEENDKRFSVYSMKNKDIDIDDIGIKKLYTKEFSILSQPYKSYSFNFLAVNTVDKESLFFDNIKYSLSEKINDVVTVDILCVIQKQ